MMAAVLAGEGLAGVAELAATEAGGPVAIVLPARGVAAGSPDDLPLEDLSTAVAERLSGRSAEPPAHVSAEQPISTSTGTVGYAMALDRSGNGKPLPALDIDEVLRAAALATATEIAIADVRDEVVSEVRGTLLEEIRGAGVSGPDALRRAARLGCDLGNGSVALVAEVRSATPNQAAALIRSVHSGALAEVLGGTGGEAGDRPTRVYALLPAPQGESSADRVVASARMLARRLRPHGPAAFSSFCADPRELPRAVSEAELALEVVSRDSRMAELLEDGMSSSVYRLLFRALAADPDEVRRFYEDTVASLVVHDREYHTDLLGTLESYLANDCNMNATARAVHAHRHTIAHRLERTKELTGYDPAMGEDRERLGLGIKAYRILAPTLTR
jgi:hypothetical protein